MPLFLPALMGIVTTVTGFFGYQVYQTHQEQQNVGAFGDPFISLQLAASPQADYILSTDGTNNSWIENTGGGGGGSGLWTYSSGNDWLFPSTASTSMTATVRGSSFTATSTTANSFPYASSTAVTATNFWGALKGNADTATALAANGANCSSGNAPLGVDASGAVESCFDVWTEAENTSAAYISGNQTITLSGDVSGSGETAITTTIGTDVVDLTMIDNSATLAGNPALAASDVFFGDNGIIFEGATADTLEGLLTTADITSSDKTWTLPNTTGTIALLTSAMTGTFDGNNFGGGAIGQGDILYGSAAGTISELAKDTNATRYLSNQGTSNNPSWNQVNLANGVTGTLPSTNIEDAYLVNDADDTTTGRLTVAGLTSSASILASSTLQITADGSANVARFFENTGGEYMDMQVDANGDLLFVDDAGGTKLSILDASETIAIPNQLLHLGDADTYIGFTDDQVNWVAGNRTFMIMDEDTVDTMTLEGDLWNFGAVSALEIPNAAAPTVDAEGEIAVDTTSGQLKYYGGSAERVISEIKEKSFIVASSTLDYYGAFGSSGTTTLLMWNPDKAVTVERIYCKARSAGTISIRFGDGTNYSETLTCTTSGVEDSSLSNNTFTANEDFEIQFGNQTSSSPGVTVTVTYTDTAD